MVDHYLAGRHELVAASLRDIQPGAVRQLSRDAMDGWEARARAAQGGAEAADQRRLAIRRLQASAALPLELVSAISTRTRVDARLDPYQEVAIDAWERLAAFEDARLEGSGSAGRAVRDAERTRLQQFRTWWRIGVLQYLLNVGRHDDFVRHARLVRLSRDDRTMQAEFHFLQGMIEEKTARATRGSAVQSSGGMGADRHATAGGRPASALRELDLAMDSAAKSYRRALDAMPDHEEARLHLGRVALDVRRPEEALTRLAPLLKTPCTSITCGLAALFTGEAHDLRGEADDAGRAYARASTVAAVRQSALVALMQLAVRRGDVRAGTGLVGHFAEGAPLPRHDGPDAWSTYLGGRRQDIGAVLGPLSKAILP